MKKRLKRIWYRIIYKRVNETKLCVGCLFDTKNAGACLDMYNKFGKDCGNKIFVKRFKLSL